MQPQSTHRQAIGPVKPVHITGPHLSYLFVAEFEDGTTITQTPEDKSELEDNRSAFYDVLQRKDQLNRFHLTDGNTWFTVDMRDGLFEINGVPFAAHNQFMDVSQYELNLVYFRETRRYYGHIPEGFPQQHVNRFFIGWWFKAPEDIYTLKEEDSKPKLLFKKGAKVEQTIAIS